MSEERTTSSEPVNCHACGSDVPPGHFCGICGAQLVGGGRHATGRAHAFAANPHEHVLHLSPVSTLFPHLPHRATLPFRASLVVTALALALLGYLRLTAPSIAIAALAVPLLYVLYLYEVEVYESEPVFVVGATFGLGIAIGALWAHFTGNIVSNTQLLVAAPQGAPIGRVLLIGVAFPIVAQLLMIVGAMILFVTRRFDEALDGFAFAAAGALGFVLGSTILDLLPELQVGPIAAASGVDNALQILERGLLVPFIYASTTGAVGAALWLARGNRRSINRHNWAANVPLTVVVALVVQIGLGLVDVYVINQVVATWAYFVIAVALLLWVRVVIHHCLLAEAVKTKAGPLSACTHCHHLVPRLAFCPNCGVATRSSPKRGSGLAGRQTR